MYAFLNLTSNDDVNSEAVIKYVVENTEKIWQGPAMESVNECILFVATNLASFEKKLSGPPANIKKSDCNIKFMAFEICRVLQMFLVSSPLLN